MPDSGPFHPPGSSLTLLMTRPSSALRAPSPRARGEGEQATHLLFVTPRPAERGEGDTKRSGVRVRGVSFAASSAHRAGPSLGMTVVRQSTADRPSYHTNDSLTGKGDPS